MKNDKANIIRMFIIKDILLKSLLVLTHLNFYSYNYKLSRKINEIILGVDLNLIN